MEYNIFVIFKFNYQQVQQLVVEQEHCDTSARSHLVCAVPSACLATIHLSSKAFLIRINIEIYLTNHSKIQNLKYTHNSKNLNFKSYVVLVRVSILDLRL